jgi:Putative endonuclease segE, GIY-YIG domain
MCWYYQEKEFGIIEEDKNIIANSVGFVYIITNKTSGRKYIGKKLFKFRKTKQVKKIKKKILVESDWMNYYSSSPKVKEDVNLYGKENFKREIICFCDSKSEMNYLEAKYQFVNNVLLSDDWYNDWISIRVTSKHLKKFSETKST